VTIMIVDDNRQMRKFIRTYFIGLDAEIVEFANGLDAVEGYKNYSPDYVLMDIKMPVMDGCEATRKILESFPDANIVMVTEYDDKHMREEAKKAGAKGYISKDNLSQLLTFFSFF